MIKAEALFRRHLNSFNETQKEADLFSDVGRARYLAMATIYAACILSEAISNLMKTEIE